MPLCVATSYSSSAAAPLALHCDGFNWGLLLKSVRQLFDVYKRLNSEFNMSCLFYGQAIAPAIVAWNSTG